jgi:hypothetical protein
MYALPPTSDATIVLSDRRRRYDMRSEFFGCVPEAAEITGQHLRNNLRLALAEENSVTWGSVDVAKK